jgi:hypothetical protein
VAVVMAFAALRWAVSPLTLRRPPGAPTWECQVRLLLSAQPTPGQPPSQSPPQPAPLSARAVRPGLGIRPPATAAADGHVPTGPGGGANAYRPPCPLPDQRHWGRHPDPARRRAAGTQQCTPPRDRPAVAHQDEAAGNSRSASPGLVLPFRGRRTLRRTSSELDSAPAGAPISGGRELTSSGGPPSAAGPASHP